MAREQLIINGLDLMAGTQWDVEDFAPALAAPIGDNPDVPGRQGVVWRPKRPGPATFTVTMWIGDPQWTRQQVWTQWETILAAITPAAGLASVTWVLDDGTTRTCDAERVGDITPTRIGTKGYRAQLEFTVPAGYWTGGPPPPAATPASAILRLYNSADTAVGDITEYDQLVVSRSRKPDPDSVEVTVRRGTPSADLLDSDWLYARVVDGGVVRPWVFVLDEDSEDYRDREGDVRPIRGVFVGLERWLDHAIVYPETAEAGDTGTAVGGDGSFMGHRFANANAGRVMNILMNRAHARGAIPNVVEFFNGTTDSAGAAWTEEDEFDETYTVGVGYRSVLDSLSGIGWCETRFNGFEMQVYRPGTLGQDRPGVVLQSTVYVQAAPRIKRRMEAKSTMLVHGDDLALYERVDATAVGSMGRREGFYRRGGVYQIGTITKLARLALNAQRAMPESLTVTMLADECPHTPGVDFDVWDTIRWDGLPGEPLRVNTITQRWTAQGEQTLELELLDRVADRADRLRKLLERVRQPDAPDAKLPKPIAPIPTIPSPGDGGRGDQWWDDIGDKYNDWVDNGGGWGGGLPPILHVGPEPPTQGELFWFDTDDFSV